MKEWLIFEWPGYHLYQGLQPMKAWVFDYPKLGCPLAKFALVYSKGATSFFVIKNDFEASGKKLFDKIKVRPEIMFKALRKVDLSAKAIFKLGQSWGRISFNNLSDRELLNYHKKLFYWDEILWRNGQVQSLLEFHNNFLSQYVRELIGKKFGEKNTNEYFGILSASRYDTRSEKQDQDFLKLLIKAKKLDKKGSKFRALLKSHVGEYRWMIYGWTGPALTEQYFLENVSAGLKNIRMIAELGNKFEEKEKILKRQDKLMENFSSQEKKLILLLRLLLETKAERVDAHSLTYFLGDQIRGEIAKRKYLSLNQLRVLTIEETEKIFKKSLDINKLNQAYDLTVYWHEKGKGVKKLLGKAAKEKYDYIFSNVPKIKNLDKIKEIKGELAFKGHVKGKVRVVLSANDFKKFKKGEILVTRVTDPNYVPLMKIAKAVITDIGGITSHAAIVSRELGVPCIIGTKIATQVLKDGMMVEVDAEQGVVRIIK